MALYILHGHNFKASVCVIMRDVSGVTLGVSNLQTNCDPGLRRSWVPEPAQRASETALPRIPRLVGLLMFEFLPDVIYQDTRNCGLAVCILVGC